MSKPYFDEFTSVRPAQPEGATTIFVLGLLGLLFCQILGIFAWLQGNDYIRRCQEMGVQPDSLAVAGRIMGIIASILVIVSLILMLGFLALGILGAMIS